MPDADDPFSPAAIAAITTHMNTDHPDDNVLIVRSLGGRPEATAASMTDLDATGAHFRSTEPNGGVDVHISWHDVPVHRVDVRHEVVRMYHAACAALGVAPRGAGEH